MPNIKNSILVLFVPLIMLASIISAILVPINVYAAACEPPASGLEIPKPCKDFNCDGLSNEECQKLNPMTQWIVFFVNLTATLIVIGASTMLIIAGIQYIAAADNPQRIQAAKEKIRNVLIGILAFFFMYAFLQWLIPGGAF